MASKTFEFVTISYLLLAQRRENRIIKDSMERENFRLLTSLRSSDENPGEVFSYRFCCKTS